MAAIGIDILTVGLTATAAVAQFQPVQANGTPAVAAGNAAGFARIAGNTGDRVPVTVLGTTVAIAAGAIAAGALVEVAPTVTQVQTKSAGVAIGRALTSSSLAGDQIEILILPN